MFWTEPTQLAIQQSNSEVTTSCRKSRRVAIVIRSRDSWPSKGEEYHHSYDHTPIFYVKGDAANLDNIRQRIKQCSRIHIALVEGSTAILPTEEFLQYLHAEKTYTSLWKDALLSTEEVLRYIQIGRTHQPPTWEVLATRAALVRNNSVPLFARKVPRNLFADLIEFNVGGNETCGNQEGEKDNLQSSVYGVIATRKHWFADNEARWHDTSTHAKCNIDHRQIVRSYRTPALQSDHRRNRMCINLCAVPGLVVSSYALSRYIVQTSLPTMKGTILHRNLTGFPTIDHPSSTTFVSVVLIYGICSMSMYRANSHHFYQQHTIFLFIICIVIFQLFRYPSLNEALGMAAAVIPAGVTIALVVSMVLHFWSPSYEDVVFRDLIKKVEKMVREGEMDLL